MKSFKQKSFSNDSDGFVKLIKWIETRASEPVHIGMEATNTYWEALAEYLSDQSLLVSVINPSLVKKRGAIMGGAQ